MKNIMSRLVLGAGLAAGLLPSPAGRAQTLNYPHPYTAVKLVWEPEAGIAEGVIIPGFFRPAERWGYIWVESSIDDYGRYLPGYWKPLYAYERSEGTMAWVPGYWSGKAWIPGYWRPPERMGYRWSEGYFDDAGRWHEPRWERTDPYAFPDGPALRHTSRLSKAATPRWGYKESLPP